MKKNKLKIASGSLLILLIVSLLYLYDQNQNLKIERDAFSLALDQTETDYSFVKNERVKEKDLYSILAKENESLLKEVLRLKKLKQEVKYVTETKYITETVEKVITKMPEEYIFYTSYNMPVCHYYKNQDNTHTFKTLPAEYSVSTITSTDQTLVKVEAKSLFDNQIYEIPLENITTEVKQIAPKKEDIFQTELSIGIIAGTDFKIPATLGVSFIKYKEFNFFKINAIANDSLELGITPVSWNLGSKASLIQDLYIEAGVKINTNPSPYVGFSTKF